MFNLEGRAVHLFLYYGPVSFSKCPSPFNIVLPPLIFPVNCNPMLSSMAPVFSLPVCYVKHTQRSFFHCRIYIFRVFMQEWPLNWPFSFFFALFQKHCFRNWVWSRYEEYSFSLAWILRKIHLRHWSVDCLHLIHTMTKKDPVEILRSCERAS